MGEDGKYIYCFIRCDGERVFAINGLGERVYTINYMGLAAVVGDFTPQNARAHRLVVEEVFKDFTVLPVRFGSTAKSTDQVKEGILKAKFYDLHDLFRRMENKVELRLKAVWKSSPMSINFIDRYYPKIRDWRQRLADAEPSRGKRRTHWIEAKVRLKEMSMNAVDDIREREAERILTAFDSLAMEKQIKAITELKMILNAAFLVDKGLERKFGNTVDELAQGCRNEIKFMCTGPFPPYSFVELVI